MATTKKPNQFIQSLGERPIGNLLSTVSKIGEQDSNESEADLTRARMRASEESPRPAVQAPMPEAPVMETKAREGKRKNSRPVVPSVMSGEDVQAFNLRLPGQLYRDCAVHLISTRDPRSFNTLVWELIRDWYAGQKGQSTGQALPENTLRVDSEA